MKKEKAGFPAWMRGILLISAIYNIAWGIFVYRFTDSFVKWITNSAFTDSYQIELHGVGLIVLSIIFFISALHPVRFWYFIFFGFLAKALGGIWVYFSVMNQTITRRFILHLVLNDYVWAILLAIIAYHAFKMYQNQD